MSDRKDLTRWNRAGLSRFNYVDGNAVEYLELLRQLLAEKFAGTNWLEPSAAEPENEQPAEGETLLAEQKRLHARAERLTRMYHQDRRDWAWEITRSFARACHILTGYADAWANEGYLGTATQWDNVRRLVGLLDYYPAPPASATTPLALMAKKGMSGVVVKGYQVKNSPPKGADKVIFETLDDLLVDAALNQLRPKGWDQSDAPAVEDAPPQAAVPKEPQYSEAAKLPAIHLQGVGSEWDKALNAQFPWVEKRVFQIRDFLGLDPTNPDLVPPKLDKGAGETWLREFKAKATAIAHFEIDPGWADISTWRLTRIVTADAPVVAELTGKSIASVEALQQSLALISAYLDSAAYARLTLAQLLAPPVAVDADAVSTQWFITKPKLVPGQLAMLVHRSKDLAEAASIAAVAEGDGRLDLQPSPVQQAWMTWPLGQIGLYVAPRWKRKCWLNGSRVIRTGKAHGVTGGAYLAWKNAGAWTYALVLRADKRNLELKTEGALPEPGTELYLLSPVKDSVVALEFEVVAILAGAETKDIKTVQVDGVPLKTGSGPDLSSLFTIAEVPSGGGGGGLLPPASLPGIGSFLFPSPLLPIDLVKAAVELMLSLGVMAIPSTGEIVIKGLPFGDLLGGASDLAEAASALFDLLYALEMPVDGGAPLKMVHWAVPEPSSGVEAWKTARKAELAAKLAEVVGDSTKLFQEIKNDLSQQGPPLIIRKESQSIATVVSNCPRFIVEGAVGPIEAGDWLVGEFSDGHRALKVGAINAFEAGGNGETFSVTFDNLWGNEGELVRLSADFSGPFAAEGANVNTSPVGAEIELEAVPESLTTGRKILLTAEGESPVVARVAKVEGNTIRTDPPAVGYSKGALIICGNVVTAGHGVGKPAVILGSGSAAQSNQEFTLEVAGVAFTPDATMRSGVAAAIEVEVAGRIWQQVSTLKDSAPDDRHYAVRMTEEGYLRILFGDGRNGRRLPTGRNNVRVRYRIGSGLAGNLPAGSLDKAVNPHPLVEAVRQYAQASGGGDMEETASLRENAPSTLLALQRAVSLADFADLATGRSNIWQAGARYLADQADRMERVAVTIVPADGVRSGNLENEVRQFLQAHALPGVQVRVESYKDFNKDFDGFDLQVTIRVKPEAFLADEVARKVAEALIERFGLKRCKLGASFYLSEVYRVVEGTPGVENSVCKLYQDGVSRQVIGAPDPSTVVCLDPARLKVMSEDYQP